MLKLYSLTQFLIFVVFAFSVCAIPDASLAQDKSVAAAPTGDFTAKSTHTDPHSSGITFTRTQVLLGSLTVFVLAVFVGFEIIAKVPPTLHTPLMSGSNAISGITVLGALLCAGNGQGGFAAFLGFIAVILAMINVVGGFAVTRRMLLMFKKK